jgi:AraC family transcriptional regulator, regulatory protein of adaptative response / methylated-DNA-[protein]-cysteine methyltransferase
VKSNSHTGHFELPIETEEGTFIAYYSEKGLAGLDFPQPAGRRAGAPAATAPEQIKSLHRLTTEALRQCLAGKMPEALPPLDVQGTEFQQRVWLALRKIAPGTTRSYSEIARAIGQPKAVRAVGGACGANPIPVLVPCHRVLAANQKIGGFSGGLNWKRTLLAREGIALE